jgi:hypothetical protein
MQQEGTKCATGPDGTKRLLDLLCHGKAQNVPQYGTKRLLGLCAMGRHKMCHGTAQNVPDLCAIGRHKMFHSTAQKDLCAMAWEGTKCATARHKKTFRLKTTKG